MQLDEQVMTEEANRSWWVFLVTGVVWLMIGFVALRLDITSVATVGFLIGGVFVVATLNEAMAASASNGAWKWVHYGLAALFVLGALWAFVNPGDSVFALASILGFILLFQGTITIATSLGSRAENPMWGFGLAVGILELLLAVWVSQTFIPARVTLILVWVGFMAIFRGVGQIVLAFGLRRTGKEMAAASPMM